MEVMDMPYKSLRELPESVRNNLPRHAQEIYQAAYNNAWEEYDHEEERAHRVAWAAVKQLYVKDDKTGKWEKKNGG
jgi:cation transport regulator